MLDVTIDLNFAFTAVEHAFHVFASLNKVVYVLHRSTDNAVVAFSDNRDIQRGIHSQELLVFQVLVRKGVQGLEHILFAAYLHYGDDGPGVCIDIIAPYSKSIANGSRVNLVFAKRLAHIKVTN